MDTERKDSSKIWLQEASRFTVTFKSNFRFEKNWKRNGIRID